MSNAKAVLTEMQNEGDNADWVKAVTESDIEMIPDIVENYDKVFVVEHNGKYDSIYYVKVADNGLIYYLEQATDKYHNENLLVNKQMIKTGLDSIPDIKGLKESINKKESSSQYLADLRKIHEAYAQSVKENYSANSIAKVPTKVKDMSAGQLERVYSLL
ncbi:MAG: hypothetical protein IJO19_02525, partial [Clostridia bacterium]|nr:hypothetical protein [Clostridia bacterium]